MTAAAAVLAGLALGLARPAGAADSAVVLEYHHVSTDAPDSTRVTPSTFESHLDFLAEHGFTVWPLRRILRHLDEGEPVPDKTVALTFDDAYESVYTEAFPRLEKRGWPFTVFVSTDYIDRGYSNYADWDQLREMAGDGADLGNHSRSHPHLVRRRDGESRQQWLARVRAQVTGAQKRLEAETDGAVKIFAYPFGEYTDAVEGLVRDLGFYGMGQQSGAVGAASDLAAAPRFPMATGFADMDQFATKVRSRALPAKVLAPDSRLLDGEPARPALRLRIPDGPYRLKQLACYASGQGRMDLQWLDRSEGTVSVRPRKPLGPGRTKYNCTAPSSETSGVFYWYSYLWIKPRADGSWYAE